MLTRLLGGGGKGREGKGREGKARQGEVLGYNGVRLCISFHIFGRKIVKVEYFLGVYWWWMEMRKELGVTFFFFFQFFSFLACDVMF